MQQEDARPVSASPSFATRKSFPLFSRSFLLRGSLLARREGAVKECWALTSPVGTRAA